jgi:mannobiose 2-epimerase
MFTDTASRKFKPTAHLSISRIATLLALAALVPPSLLAKDVSQYAHEIRGELTGKILPYWYDTAIDKEHGGYVLSDDAAKPAPPAVEKQLVTQARMVWGFSHAHIHGLGDGRRDYLDAARQGYRFLLTHFRDREKGGYFWTTDLVGAPKDERKLVYGEAFVIYAFVEYYRASGDKEALSNALDLFNQLQTHAHDPKYGGWVEHFQRDWTPILDASAQVIVERAGCKSANTHLHLMEALSELYQATNNRTVRKALLESVKINTTWFYPADPGKSAFHRHLDWTPVTEPASQGLSYGHNVEFAWLLVRAQQVLRERPSWSHVEAHMNHALKYGYDHLRGGLYSRGFDDQPATDTDKVWWVQAEMLAALTECLKHKENMSYSQALRQLLDFVSAHQANPTDGIWLDTVKAEGTPKVTAKAHNRKANYHDVRAMVKFSEAFGARPSSAAASRGPNP